MNRMLQSLNQMVKIIRRDFLDKIYPEQAGIDEVFAHIKWKK